MNLNAQLTSREWQVIGRVADGDIQKEVAEKLHISENTVSNHLTSIYRKTGSRSVGQVCKWFFVKRFNLSLDEVNKALATMLFFFLIGVNELNTQDTAVRASRARVTRVKTTKRKQ